MSYYTGLAVIYKINDMELILYLTRTGAHCFYRSLGYTSDKKQLNFKKYLCGE